LKPYGEKIQIYFILVKCTMTTRLIASSWMDIREA